jgi:hypothetical protein
MYILTLQSHLALQVIQLISTSMRRRSRLGSVGAVRSQWARASARGTVIDNVM